MKNSVVTLVAADPPVLVERDPNSVASRVLAYMRTDPEQSYRPTEIATAVGITSTSAANALRVLTLRGDITRHRNALVRNGPGASVYTYHEASAPLED